MELNNEIKNEQAETEAVSEINETLSLSETIAKDLSVGAHSLLFKRINSITITEPKIKEAFSRFIKDVECGKSFSISDIICSSESLLKKGEPDENAGNIIFCFDHYITSNKRFSAKLLKNSVSGIYPLFALHNGIAIDIGVCGGNLAAAETKRFLIAPEFKAKKIVDEAASYGVRMVRAGVMLSTNNIILTLGNETIANVGKDAIGGVCDAHSISLGQEHLAAFISGYNAVCSYALCGCISANNILRFGLNCDLSTACARALGYFSAAMHLKLVNIRTAFTQESSATVVSPKPSVSDGDYLYLLKLRKDLYGAPENGHFGQLYYYLAEKKRMGTIKDVLPIRENILPVIKRLCDENLEYVPLADIPTDCFGVVVSVRRGDSVNGVKLGYFKNI